MQLYYIRNLIKSLVLWFTYLVTFNIKILKAVKKSLGFDNINIYFKQTLIFYREFIFRLSQILKDIITKYTLLRFLFNKAVNSPTIKIYINLAVFLGRKPLNYSI